MYLTQQNKKRFVFQLISLVSTLSFLIFKKVKTKFELQIQIAYNLRKLLYIKIQQIKKYNQKPSLILSCHY